MATTVLQTIKKLRDSNLDFRLAEHNARLAKTKAEFERDRAIEKMIQSERHSTEFSDFSNKRDAATMFRVKELELLLEKANRTVRDLERDQEYKDIW